MDSGEKPPFLRMSGTRMAFAKATTKSPKQDGYQKCKPDRRFQEKGLTASDSGFS